MTPPGRGKLGIVIAVGHPDRTPPPYKAGGADLSSRNNAQETPTEERAFHKQGGPPSATPESVNYRTSHQTCANCEYLQGADCLFLKQPVEGGDSCNRFEDKAEDQGADEVRATETIGVGA